MGPDTIFCERIPTWSDVFTNDLNALLRRGWAFQESALSKRTLHYSACGLVWECRSTMIPHYEIKSPRMQTRAARGPAPKLSRLLTPSYDNERQERIPPAQESERSRSRAIQWMDLVSDYSSRSLTWNQDKLPALSGIASAVSQATGWTYLAGHWEQVLLSSLCWSVSSSFAIPISASEGSPSWSWASINGQVESCNPYCDPRCDVDTGPYDGREIRARALDSACAAAGLNPFGQTKGGYVTLLGCITVARLGFKSSSSRYYVQPLTQSSSPTHGLFAKIDTLLEECDCKKPIFHGTKTFRRKHESTAYDSPDSKSIFIELLLIVQGDHSV